jgi:hypothetical protein
VGAGLIDPTPIIEAEQQEAAKYLADEVLRTAPCPVLLVRVSEAGRGRVEVPIL